MSNNRRKMNASKISIFLLNSLIIMAFLTNNVSGLQCYKCSSEIESACHEDKFEPKSELIVDCSELEPTKKSTGCKKWLRREDQIWIRECIYDVDSKDTSKICGDLIWDWRTFTVHGAKYEACTTCSNNLCNSNDKAYYKSLFH